MEEMDMVKRARQYLEALSTGMDPISKKQVPPGDTLLQPRLSRCFHYVSELLKGIEKDPALLKRLADARPSHETKGNEKAYPYGAASSARMQEENKLSAPGSAENRKDGRLSLSKITENLRPLLGENPEMTLETSEITEWLLLSGYLCHITRETDGAHRIVPTEKGEKLGITRVERTRQDGKLYHFNLYSQAAQDFIRQHLEDILSQSSKRLFLKGPYRHSL